MKCERCLREIEEKDGKWIHVENGQIHWPNRQDSERHIARPVGIVWEGTMIKPTVRDKKKELHN